MKKRVNKLFTCFISAALIMSVAPVTAYADIVPLAEHTNSFTYSGDTYTTKVQWNRVDNNVTAYAKIEKDSRIVAKSYSMYDGIFYREQKIETSKVPATCTQSEKIIYNVDFKMSDIDVLAYDDYFLNNNYHVADQYEESIDAPLGHSYPKEPMATDWKKDKSYHWLECNRNNCSDRESSIKDKAEHTYVGDICSVCDYECAHTDNQNISTLVKIEANAPTCTEAGNIAYWTCSECGLKFADEAGTDELADDGEVSPALKHHYPENPVQTDWKKDGSDHWLECDRDNCSNREGSIEDKVEHSYVGDTCSVCGFKRTHVHYGFSKVDAKEATCTEAGHDVYYTCSGCDALFKDGVGAFGVSFADLTIPATGHKYDGYQQDTEGHWQVCSVCGEATVKESHHFNGNACTVCGYQKPETEKAETNTETKTETSTTTTSSSGSSHHDSAEVTDSSQKGRWVQDEKGWYFQRNDGSYPQSGWSKLKWLGKEYWYYFDENGYMKLGWLDVNGSRYYLNPVIGTNSGKMLTGWQQIDQKWYYFSTETGAKEGSLLRNTVTPDNYRVDENGIWQQ